MCGIFLEYYSHHIISSCFPSFWYHQISIAIAIAIGSDQDGVIGNHEKVSYGGQYIRDFVKEKDHVILNNMATGGPWTWVKRGDDTIKSCLDIAIASRNLLPFVKSVTIDKERKFTPKRVISKKGEYLSVHTDHFTMEIVLSEMPKKKVKIDKISKWNFHKPGGWEAYKELSDKAADKIEMVINDENLEIDEAMGKIESIEKEIKFASFGKSRINSNKGKRNTNNLYEVKDEDILKEQSKQIEEQVNKVKEQKLGRIGSIFKLKEGIIGPKKGAQEPTAVRHPDSGDMVVANEEIKRVTLEYCAKNLENGSPDPEVEEDATIKRQLHDLRMKDTDDDDFNMEFDDFNSVLQKFSTKSTHSYDLLLKAGPKYKDVMFKVCKSMIEKEEFPSSFRKTLLNMIWKRKGPAEILSNNRFIHTKESFLPRTCEALVTNKMKQRILENSTKYQIGGQPGHSPDEHIYSIKSVWQVFEMMGKGLIITLVDIKAFFDKENIYDVMQTLNDIGVNKKAARVWFKLNEGTEISVKTAAGISETAYVGDCIGQGTAGAALVSQVNLDQGLHQYFGDGGENLEYGEVSVAPLAYQDDIMKGSKDVIAAQAGNTKLAAMLQDKGLDAHPEKTCFLICGSKGFKEKSQKELEVNPLKFGTFPVKQKVSDKYLGQVLHSGGVEASAEATVLERSGNPRNQINSGRV